VSKSHPEQWIVREVAERPERSLVTALREFDTTQIADCGGPVAINVVVQVDEPDTPDTPQDAEDIWLPVLAALQLLVK
jgi:hypothetical protein